jgi:hypothetical protein
MFLLYEYDIFLDISNNSKHYSYIDILDLRTFSPD